MIGLVLVESQSIICLIVDLKSCQEHSAKHKKVTHGRCLITISSAKHLLTFLSVRYTLLNFPMVKLAKHVGILLALDHPLCM